MPRIAGSKSPPESLQSGDEEPIDLTSEVAGSDLVPVSKLKHIWDAQHIESCTIDGVDGWKCLWCCKPFKRKRSTRVLWHLLKIGGQGIATCLALIPEEHLSMYCDLYNRNVGRAHARVKAKNDNNDYVGKRHHTTVSSMTAKRAAQSIGARSLSGPTRDFNRGSPQNSLGFHVSATNTWRVTLGYLLDAAMQPSIETVVTRQIQTDINAVNYIQLLRWPSQTSSTVKLYRIVLLLLQDSSM